MVPVKAQGRYEVFSRGVEEPWVIYRNGALYKQVWTWPEVEAILRGEPSTGTEPRDLTARDIRAALKERGYRVRASSRSGVRGEPGRPWEAQAVHRDRPILSTHGHASQLDALRELYREVVRASGQK